MRFLLLCLLTASASALTPVVIVPGDGSNQLEARLNKPSTVSWRCDKKSDWFRLWLDTKSLLGATDCWADNIKLVYDEESDTLSNNAGVETRVPDFGGTSAFEELDPSIPFHATAAFRTMVQRLVSGGLEKNITLRGAPYDFRYAPSSQIGAQYIQDLTLLIESTVNATGPFGGAAKIMRLHASGDNQGLPVSALTIREEQRSYETNFWLAPVPQRFGNDVLVSTPTRNYSAQDYDAFFDDIGYSAGKKLLKRVLPLTSNAQAPGVDVVCMYSLGVPTPIQFSYDKSGFDKTPIIINGDGDGTVNEVSLRLCEQWAGKQQRSVKVKKFSNITHSGMLADASVLAAVLAEVGLSTKQTIDVLV